MKYLAVLLLFSDLCWASGPGISSNDIDELFVPSNKSEGVYSLKYSQDTRKELASTVKSVHDQQMGTLRSIGRYFCGGDDCIKGNWVMVNIEMVCGILSYCLTKDLSISGGSGDIHDDGKSVVIYDVGRGIAGRYSYFASFEGNRYCSGTFDVSGTKRNYTIRVYDSCKDAGSSEY